MEITCKSCESVLEVKGESVGSNQKCPVCGNTFKVPPPPNSRRVACSHCGQVFWLSDSLLGKWVVCPRCTKSFLALAGIAEAAQWQGTGGGTKMCPFCAEIILAQALKCKHCGEFLNGKANPAATHARSGGSTPKGEGLFLQTMNAGCAVVLGIIIFLFMVVLLAGC